MFCIKCGEKLDKDDKFCIKCGTKVQGLEENTMDEKKSESNLVNKEVVKEEPEVINEKKQVIKTEPVVLNNPVNNNVQPKSNGWKVALIVILSVVGVLLIVGAFFLTRLIVSFLSKDTTKEINESEKEIKEEVKEERKKSDVFISFYKSVSSDYILEYVSNSYKTNYYENDDNYELVGKYQCYNEDCTYKTGAGTSAVIYDDDDYIVYDIEDEKTIELSIDVDKDTYMNAVYYDGKLYGLSVSGTDGYAYYDISNDKFVTDYLYDGFNSDASLKDGIIIAYNAQDINDNSYYIIDNLYYILDSKTGKTAYDIGNIAYISAEENNNHIYYLVSSEADGYFGPYNVYNNKFEKIMDSVTSIGILSNGNFMVKNDKNGFSIYDSKGSLVKESKEYTDVKLVVNDYVAVIDDGYLKLVDYNEDVVATFTEWNDKKIFHEMISGYYTDNGTKVHGVYLVVEDTSIEEGTKGRGNEYYYGTETKETGVIELEFIGGYAKPVLYLYPEKETNVTVTFEDSKKLTTTYPKYTNKWSVKALPNGDLYDKNGRYYYGLYWEEIKNHDIDFNEGFYVTSESAIDFLEEKLSMIGFTEREANEFIMYWLPILESNGQSLVYFELTDEREAYNKLNINPNPDSLLRVAMHVKKVDSYVDIKEQKLDTFKRNGFSAVEWGGVIH